MKLIKRKASILLLCMLLLSACSDKPAEPVDEEGTQKLNAKLLESMQEISDAQTEKAEGAGEKELERLSEADRQALIDLTIDESAEAVKEDADKVVDLIEELNNIAND